MALSGFYPTTFHTPNPTPSSVPPGVKIGKNVVIKRAIIGENAQIGDGAVIEGNEDKIEVVGNSERIGVLPNEN